MPKVSDLIQHINSNYPVLDLTENLVKGVYFADNFDDIASVPAAIQSSKALALIGNTPKIYNAFEGSNFTASESWREIVTSPVDYPELVGVDLVDDQSGLLERYQVILYDSVDNVFKKTTLDSLFGGLGAFLSYNSSSSVVVLNPNTNIVGDFDGDGDVTAQDLLSFLSAYGTGINSLNPVIDISPTDVLIDPTVNAVPVVYGALNYEAGDKLYIKLGVSTVFEAGNYPLTITDEEPIELVDQDGNVTGYIDPPITSPGYGGSIEIGNPVSNTVTLSNLTETLPNVYLNSAITNAGIGFGVYTTGLPNTTLTNYTFGLTVRFYAESDEGVVQVGDDLDVPLITSIQFLGNFAFSNPFVNGYNITGPNYIIRDEWESLSNQHNIHSIRFYMYSIFDEPTNDVESAINNIFYGNLLRFKVDL